jgi:hypothetical protein
MMKAGPVLPAPPAFACLKAIPKWGSCRLGTRAALNLFSLNGSFYIQAAFARCQ